MNDGGNAVRGAVNRADIHNLSEHVVKLGASEVVLALEERRNALPLDDLLRVKTTGVHVNDLSSFLERETGRVDLDSLNPSWLIFSDGFSAGRRLSSAGKRLFDIVVSIILLLVAIPLVAIAAIAIKLESRGPVFFRQRRVGLYGQHFEIIKLRSMREDAEVGGVAVWAQEHDPRVTRVGALHPQAQDRRAAAGLERAQGRDELRRPASRAAAIRRRPRGAAALLCRAPHGEARHHRLGADQLSLRRRRSTTPARSSNTTSITPRTTRPSSTSLILLQTMRVILWPEGAR